MKKILLGVLFALFAVFSFSCKSKAVKVRQLVISGDPATTKDAQNFDLYIIHTNDVCGYINDENRDLDYMNAETLAGFISGVRKFNAHTLVLDAGNFTYGTLLASKNKGRDMITLAKKMGYNALAIGDQDLRYGFDALRANVDYALKPSSKDAADEVYFVSQNLKRRGKLVTDKFKIFNVNGFMVAVVGLSSPNSEFEINPAYVDDLTFDIDYRELQKDLNSLKRKVGYTILLANIGNDPEQPGYLNIEQVMQKIKNVDLVIDGHSGSELKEPLICKDFEGKDVPVVQTGSHMKNVGLIQLTIAEGLVDGDPICTLIPATEIREPGNSPTVMQFNIAQRPNSADVKAFSKSLEDALDSSQRGSVAFLPFVLSGDKVDSESKQSDMGYNIASGMAKDVEAQVSMFPGSLIKNDLQPGEVTRQDVYKAFPCDEIVYRVPMTGAQIYEALEYSYEKLPELCGRYLQTNLQVTLDFTGDPGERVVSVLLDDGTPIGRDTTPYHVAVLESMIKGVEGFTQFSPRNAYKGGVAWEAFAAQLSASYPMNN